ncbi:MAG TPA: hypothetical protein VFA97_01915 [Gaiellaceae bacterium]|nr:hypothetical protein [Gaiellaceae bacterium]
MEVGGPHGAPDVQAVRPLRPLRVLVAGGDERYVRSTEFLLGRCGYETRRVRHARPLVDDARLRATDILLLEGEASPESAEQEAAGIVALLDHVAVVVATRAALSVQHPRILAVEKWAALDEVLVAVNCAWAAIGPRADSPPTRPTGLRLVQSRR